LAYPRQWLRDPYQRFLLNGTESASIAKQVEVATGLLPIHQEEK